MQIGTGDLFAQRGFERLQFPLIQGLTRFSERLEQCMDVSMAFQFLV